MRTRIAPIAAALAALAGLASCNAVEYSEAYEVDEPVSRMVVDVDRGHLEVVGADIDTVQVERHIDGWEGNLELETRVVDGVLYITARCAGVLRCDVDSVITVPHDLDIEANVDVGHITVSRLEGAADLQSSAEERATTNEQKLVLALMEEDEARPAPQCTKSGYGVQECLIH